MSTKSQMKSLLLEAANQLDLLADHGNPAVVRALAERCRAGAGFPRREVRLDSLRLGLGGRPGSWAEQERQSMDRYAGTGYMDEEQRLLDERRDRKAAEESRRPGSNRGSREYLKRFVGPRGKPEGEQG